MSSESPNRGDGLKPQLEKHRIIKAVSGAKRTRANCAQKLLDILEEPAKLSPAGKF